MLWLEKAKYFSYVISIRYCLAITLQTTLAQSFFTLLSLISIKKHAKIAWFKEKHATLRQGICENFLGLHPAVLICECAQMNNRGAGD